MDIVGENWCWSPLRLKGWKPYPSSNSGGWWRVLQILYREMMMSNRLPFLFTIVDRNICIPCLLTNGTPLTYGTYNHGQEDKRLGTFLHFWGVFQFTQVQQLLSPHKQYWTHVSRIFSGFELWIGWVEGRTARKFRKGCTVLRGNREMTEKYEYCSTVIRTFVQDCSLEHCIPFNCC